MTFKRFARRQQPEAILQRSAIQWLRACLIPPAFAVSIETGRSTDAARMRDAGRGVMPGLADSWVFWRHADKRTMVFCIEFKSATGKLSDAQIHAAKLLASVGISTYTCRSIEQVEEACRREGVPLRVSARVATEPATVRGARNVG